MTFCDSQTCVTMLCPRRLTPDVWTEARKWWGGDGAPIAVGDFTMTCPEYRELDEVGLT